MHRITIKDIAGKLKVSPSTVSRALAGHTSISAETSGKIRELARELNYQPNLNAKSLRLKKTGVLALILPEMNHFFIPEMLYGIHTAAHDGHFSIIQYLSNNSFEREKELLHEAIQFGVDGVLLSVSEETISKEHILELTENECPVLLLDKVRDDSPVPGMTIDGYRTAYDATDYLIHQGHRNIAGLFGNPGLLMTQNRKRGFLQALSDNDIPPEQGSVLEVEQILELSKLFRNLMEQSPGITAVFAMSDELMVNCHHELMSMNRRIPEDVSLMAISDGVAPYYLYPNISHMHHSGFETGHRATFELIRWIEQKKAPELITYSTCRLCELHSVKDINPSYSQ